MPWERSCEAALRPARPEPTTMAVFPGLAGLVDMASLVICEMGDVRWRYSMDESAMKSEMAMMRMMRLRLIYGHFSFPFHISQPRQWEPVCI